MRESAQLGQVEVSYISPPGQSRTLVAGISLRSGAVNWAKGLGSNSTVPSALTISESGQLALAATTNGIQTFDKFRSDPTQNAVIAMLDTQGNTTSLHPLDLGAGGVNDLAFGSSGALYLTGTIAETSRFAEIIVDVAQTSVAQLFLAKLASDGSFTEADATSGGRVTSSPSPSLTLDACDNIYVSTSFSQSITVGSAELVHPNGEGLNSAILKPELWIRRE